MTRPRKTFDVELFKVKMNERIQRESNPEARRALCFVLSDILLETDNYRGFQYTEGWKGVENYLHRYY